MKISDATIDSGSLTGKSGINLDTSGFVKNSTSLTFWVIDGVSPLIFIKKHVWQFRKFYIAGQLLNQAFEQNNWKDIQHTFSSISKNIKKNKIVEYFLSGAFFHWPLFSCGLVKINSEKNLVECALYGDCVVIIKRGNILEKIEYQELESKKETINSLFKIMDKYLKASLSGCLKKTLFAIIRIKQIWFGKLRVLSIKKYFPPPVIKLTNITDIDNIVILSDGVSWYIKNDAAHTRRLMESISEQGVQPTLNWLRSVEDMNTDFGKYDDSTIISISL